MTKTRSVSTAAAVAGVALALLAGAGSAQARPHGDLLIQPDFQRRFDMVLMGQHLRRPIDQVVRAAGTGNPPAFQLNPRCFAPFDIQPVA